jgi:hypothetical protein
LPDSLPAIARRSASERRVIPRERVLFSSVQLADRNGGIVLNISANGLAMRVVNGLAQDEFTEVRFQVCQSTDWVETRCRIAWVDDPRTTVGVEFVDLPLESRTVLDKWIASIRELEADTTPHTESHGTAEGTDAVSISLEKPVEAPMAGEDSEAPKLGEGEEVLSGSEAGRLYGLDHTSLDPAFANWTDTDSQSRSSTAASLGVLEPSPDEISFRSQRRGQPSDRKWTVLIVLLAIVVLILEVLYGLAHFQHGHQSAVPETRRAAPGPPPPDAKGSASAFATAIPENTAGFVVQAGAMAERGDAVALADSLQQKGFPSFVFKRDSSRLYEVFVGPYPSADRADRIRRALESEGNDSFVREWPIR